MKENKEINDTTFILMRGKTPFDPELQEIINKAVKGFGFKKETATKIALRIVAAVGQKALCDVPSLRDPDKCFIFLENKV